MNLQKLIERYIAYRRSFGEQFKANACILRIFGRSAGSHAEVGAVRPEQVSAFLAGHGPITRYWFAKYDALRGFYRYAVSRGYVATVPLPTRLPKRPPPFVPYIYSHEELRRLLETAAAYQGRGSVVEAVTIRTLVLLLYGAGLRLSEAINLDRADVDTDHAILTIRQTKFGKTRLVPFGCQLGSALARYAVRGPKRTAPKAPFFTTHAGARLKQHTVQRRFRRICAQADIRRSDAGRFQPRLHDLRHTFAVHRLVSWYQQGADVQRLLPQLSTYLGHTSLVCTQVYLSMTPELLHEASKRFERYARGEDSHA
jgi:site-specific recombinase XerD